MPLPENYTQEEWDYDNEMSNRVRAFHGKSPIIRNYNPEFHQPVTNKNILIECGYESDTDVPNNSHGLRGSNLFGSGK